MRKIHKYISPLQNNGILVVYNERFYLTQDAAFLLLPAKRKLAMLLLVQYNNKMRLHSIQKPEGQPYQRR